MKPRYAVYYAPAPGDPLHAATCAWLGRDAFTGQAASRVTPPGLAGLDLDALTADPAGYGFHATLKAPFELAEGCAESALAEAVTGLSGARTAFTANIAPATIGDFIAFRIQGACPDMDALEADCVRAFEPYRAPITEYDIVRKRRAGLTPEQDRYLLEFGYPYIFEFFRFHMTLTGRIRDPDTRAVVLEALKVWFEPVSGPHVFGGLTLFKQDARGAPFHHVLHAPFIG
ncbi:MAG: DUF1045 domain-containing protein [Hyphomonadaceae bacterium]|nr:MAG: phosphonate metabolism protein [Caulobacteraceae bacterium]MBT9445655.1 DUF1045 domain-containing protein [Hyphomonadaceae bacterium]TPW05543.1 MAG: phosphonate metabolism protein [Alphaproteobacteria bacterium]